MKPFLVRGLIAAVAVAAVACQQPAATSGKTTPMNQEFDWQGHRGARGLLPENSVPAFLKALEYPVRTLELDVVVSRDSQIVVSHEPWLSHHICLHSDGRPVEEAEEEQFILLQMDYEQIAAHDCGSRGNASFPEQAPAAVAKPTLAAVVAAVEAYCREKGRALPAYNIEIKSQPDWDEVRTPAPDRFARLVLAEIDRLGIRERTCVQSFDVRSLQAVRRRQPDITLALLVANPDGVAANLRALGFVPPIYSPYYRLVSANVVDTVHEQGMRIVPWTVNDTAEMRTLIDMGVDGIITDYPDRIGAVGR